MKNGFSVSFSVIPARLAGCGLLALALCAATGAQQPSQAPAPTSDSQQPAAPSQTPTPSATPDAAQQPAPNSLPAPSAAGLPAPAPATPEAAPAQQPAAAPEASQPAAPQNPAPAATQAPARARVAASTEPAAQSESTIESQLKQQLIGKALYLRGGYLDNTLNFDEHGHLIGRSPQGSFTLSAIQIDHLRLTKHKVEMEGLRYGLHFLGELPYEDPAKAMDRVRITPKKKVVKITIDREIVVSPKKKKNPDAGKGRDKKSKGPQPAAAPAQPELTEADQLKASIAAAPVEERPSDEKSVTTTIFPSHAAQMLNGALDSIFAQGLDERMMAAMPDFWKLYYKAVEAKADYRPADPAVMRQNTVDKKARLLSTFEPPSNEFAQANAVAGMALYHVVIGPDGKPGELAVARPIGFGLDENAVDSIRKAKFEPAMKDGKPVPVLLDLVVQFRIYSKRTSVIGTPEPADKPATPQLPGPYSVPR
jgi:outer membrane biosynthesis protein TonB